MPLKEINPKKFAGVILGIKPLSFLKYRKFDYFFFFSSNWILVIATRENAIGSQFSSLLYDRMNKKLTENTFFKMGSFSTAALSDNPFVCNEQVLNFTKGNFTALISTKETTEACNVKVTYPGENDKPIKLELNRPLNFQSMNDVSPISPDHKHWLYSQKITGFPATAVINAGK